jgi:hypothetical protein
MSDLIEALPALAPLQFFSIKEEIKSGKVIKNAHKLESFSRLLNEDQFADVSLAWNEESLIVEVEVFKPFEEASYPDYDKGDAIELFFDTRDLKSAGFMTRFCHHFVILPKDVQGVQVQELTTFRTEDTHPLCDSADISLQTTFTAKGYKMTITFPAHTLHGYEPSIYDRLGFTYRIHRYKGSSQHFSVSSHLYKIEQHPSLWASMTLSKGFWEKLSI